MEISQIIELMKAVAENGLTDFSYEEGNISIKIKKHPEKKVVQPQTIVSGVQAQPMTAPAAMQVEAGSPSAAQASETLVSASELSGQVVKSPLVGTFYAASSPEAEPYIKVGDTVQKGQVLGIVEAMKLMNEIESDYDGVVKEILVKDGELIEFDQPLFVIE